MATIRQMFGTNHYVWDAFMTSGFTCLLFFVYVDLKSSVLSFQLLTHLTFSKNIGTINYSLRGNGQSITFKMVQAT